MQTKKTKKEAEDLLQFHANRFNFFLLPRNENEKSIWWRKQLVCMSVKKENKWSVDMEREKENVVLSF